MILKTTRSSTYVIFDFGDEVFWNVTQGVGAAGETAADVHQQFVTQTYKAVCERKSIKLYFGAFHAIANKVRTESLK